MMNITALSTHAVILKAPNPDNRARGPHNPMTLDCIKQRIYAAGRDAYRREHPAVEYDGGKS